MMSITRIATDKPKLQTPEEPGQVAKVQTAMQPPPPPQPISPPPVTPPAQITLWQRVKRVKNIEIYAAGLVVLVMIAIYASNFLGGVGGSTTQGNDINSIIAGRHNQFAREMEQRLVTTLSQVRGAGRVEAMVTVVGSATLEIAYNIDERTVTQNGPNGSGTTTTTIVKTPVIVQGSGGPQPLILLEIKPQLTGVVIVATGAHDISVRLQLLRAVQALVGDPSVNIEILSGR